MPQTTFHTTYSNNPNLFLRTENGSESGLRGSVSYRFGFTHAMAWQVPKENPACRAVRSGRDNEVKGTGNQQDYGMRISAYVEI